MGRPWAADRALALDTDFIARHQSTVVHTTLAVFLVEPHGVAYPLFVDYQRRPVMRPALDLPAVEGGALHAARSAIRLQADQGVVALVRRKNMAPHEQRGAIGVDGAGHPAAFAGMVGQFEFGLETTAAIGR